MVSDCTKHLQPGPMPYIDDLLFGSRAVYKSDGLELDYKAMLQAHLDQVIALFETLEKCHVKVRFEKCHMFVTKVKYCGHILHDGKRSPAPSKVNAIQNWKVTMMQIPKQMKEFLGLVNWYSINIKNYADLAAPLMESLQKKYKHATKVQGQKDRCKITKEDNFINCTPEMRANFETMKQAICTTYELYISSPEGGYAFHVDACTYGIGAVLEQKTPNGKWVPCAFLSRKLDGKPGQGQRGWSVQEQETYAIVSCLLKFKSWVSGRKVTIFSDHKSLESWYREDLCTLTGPLGRRGWWHQF